MSRWISLSLWWFFGVLTVCAVSRPLFSVFPITLRTHDVCALGIFEQTCPYAKELLFHYLDDFISPSGWTHAGFRRFIVKPSTCAHAVFLQQDDAYAHAVFLLCFCNEAYLHSVFLQLTWTNFVILWPNTFWPLVILCKASIYVPAVLCFCKEDKFC